MNGNARMLPAPTFGKGLALVASALFALVASLVVLSAPAEGQIEGRAIAQRVDVIDGFAEVLFQGIRPGKYEVHVTLYDAADQPVEKLGRSGPNPKNFDVLVAGFNRKGLLLDADNPEGVQETTPDPFPNSDVWEPYVARVTKPYATSWGEVFKVPSSIPDSGTATKEMEIEVNIADDDPNRGFGLSDVSYAIVTIREPPSTQELPSIESVESEVADRGSPVRITVNAANPEGTEGLYYDFDCNNDGDYTDRGVDEQDSEDNVGECTFPERGTYPVTARIYDGNPFDTETTTVTVGNVAPVVNLMGNNAPDEGRTETYNFTVTDPGSASHTVTTSCGTGGKKIGSDSYDQQTRKGSFGCKFPDGPASSEVSVNATDDEDKNGSDSMTAQVANVAPVARSQGDVATSQGTAKLITLSATDAGNDPVGYEIAGLPAHGKLYKGDSTASGDEITAAGTTLPANKVTYVPDAGYFNTPRTPDSFRFRANDGIEDGNEATVSVAVQAGTISGGTVTSLDDGQETTGDGFEFANRESGTFVKLRARNGDFELQTRQGQVDETQSDTYNFAAGVKVNETGSIISVDYTGKVFFGMPPREISAPFEAPGGGKVERQGGVVTITSAAGDVVTITDRGRYLDVEMEANPERTGGMLTGSLGHLDSDADPGNDLVGRDGRQMTDIAAFIEQWRVKDGESMFGDVGGPTPNRAPITQDKQDVTTNEDTAKLVTFSATDHENDALSYEIRDMPDHGKLYIGDSTEPEDEIRPLPSTAGPISYRLPSGTDQVTYVPDANYNNTSENPDAFKFRAFDGFGPSFNEGTVSVTVTPIVDTAEIKLDDLNHTYDGTAKSATATADREDLDVELTYADGDGNPVESPTDAGSYGVTATIDDPEYEGRETGTLVIEKAPLTVVADNKTKTYGAENPALTGTLDGVVDGDGITATYGTTATRDSAAGSYPISPSLSDPAGRLSNYEATYTNGTLTVTKATATVSLGNLVQTYDGTAKTATAITDPAGLNVKVVYTRDGQTVESPTGVGSYNVTATIDDAGHAGGSTGALLIEDRGAPDTSISDGPEGKTKNNKPTFSFGGSDDATAGEDLVFSYKLDDGDWSDYSSATSATLGGADGLPDGVHTFRVRAKDAAGNVDESPAERDFKVDAAKPTVTATPSEEPNEVGWHKANVTVTLEASDGEDSDVASISYKVNGNDPTTVAGDTATVDISDEGINTITYHATDGAGNDGDEQNFTVKLDKSVPTAECAPAGTDWQRDDVSIGCTASDAVSGLADADKSFSLATSVPIGTETNNASTGGRTVTDSAGNAATVGPISGIKVDKKAPAITLTAPAQGAVYERGQTVKADYACGDGGSGLASCSGTAANGANADTASVGDKVFEVKATDDAGNQATIRHDYRVREAASPLDRTAPKGTVLINGGAMSTSRLAVLLTLKATDEGGSGVAGMRFSNDGRTWSAWEPYARIKIWTLAKQGKETRTVYVQFKDGAGNVSSPPATDSIRISRNGGD